MALKIKLQKTGKRDDVSYRIVVAEDASKRNGKVTALLGFYKPKKNSLNLNRQLLEKWISYGAKPTKSVWRLISTK